MRISDLLRNKGSEVATISGEATVADLLAMLAERNVGALVVADTSSQGKPRLVGIVSERDIVRHLHRGGAAVLSARVADIMTTDVYSCVPEDHVDSLAETMTERRVRHMPVIVDDKLVGIVSIGDVVKSRISELESDRQHLESYIAGG
ncbi:CBS domain-containing protein [Hoyosella rhizosphaerae]|uniref:CBS domain-containing protein n=1 Tax=Hoyosella rhizosphaerae TaxID=1755582 RepID=A0A916XB86_9ACTN|nr:CBS domain-containing protein [Hoyosella rhizosphaerae]MBN4926226.1 CBS domain-containing protein [Hoyosella rhizosphaerae]GGC61081.1 CBS domain-containing protein [Hoyosella rhizosphaerae]